MNMGIIIVIAIAIIWGLGVFMGAIGGFSKAFKNTPSAIDSSDVKARAQDSIEETEARRKQLMEDMKQKIQDSSHRY